MLKGVIAEEAINHLQLHVCSGLSKQFHGIVPRGRFLSRPRLRPKSRVWPHRIDNEIAISQEVPLLLSRRQQHKYDVFAAPTHKRQLIIRMILDRGGVYLASDNEDVSGRVACVTELAHKARFTFDTERPTPAHGDS